MDDSLSAGERSGRTATIIKRVVGNPVLNLYTVHLGTIEIPLQVRVSASSKVERASIDASLDIAMVGDFDNGSPVAVSQPVTDYYDQVFQFRQAGSTRYSDSTTTAGRKEFVSVREIEAYGAVLVDIIAAGFADLSMDLKTIEADRDFDLVVAEDVNIFNILTP